MTAKRLKSADFPQDNSHLPVTLKPGDRVGWWYKAYSNSEAKFRSTASDLLSRLDSPGHTPTLTLVDASNNYGTRIETTLTCSCGREDSRRWIFSAASGRWSKSFPAQWNAHKAVRDTLATPILVWESQATRATYRCYVASTKHLDRYNIRWRPSIEAIYVVTTSSTPNAHARIRTTSTSVADAIALAQKCGREEEADGRTVTWYEEPVVTSVSSSVADLLLAIQKEGQSDDLRTLLATKKLADEFLSYTEPISQARDTIQRRIDKLFSFDE